jgi:UDP-glucuronate 4-epimerase
VLGVDAFTDYYPRPLKDANLEEARGRSEFELVEADLTEAALPELVEGVDGIFHLAAQPGVRGSWGETFALYARDNLIATQRIFEAAIEAGCRVAWASSSSVYGNAESYPTREDVRPSPISPYGVTKLSCESLAAAYGATRGLDAVALRYFTVYGPWGRPDMSPMLFARAIMDGKPLSVFNYGDMQRDFTYIDDIVEGTIRVLDRPARYAVYNIGNHEPVALLDYIALLERALGAKAKLDMKPMQPGDVKATYADTTALRNAVGFAPSTPLAMGLERFAAWFKQYYGYA